MRDSLKERLLTNLSPEFLCVDWVFSLVMRSGSIVWTMCRLYFVQSVSTTGCVAPPRWLRLQQSGISGWISDSRSRWITPSFLISHCRNSLLNLMSFRYLQSCKTSEHKDDRCTVGTFYDSYEDLKKTWHFITVLTFCRKNKNHMKIVTCPRAWK